MVIDSSWVPILVAIGLSLVIFSFLMLAFCYWFRRRRQRRQSIRTEVIETYRPLFFEWMSGESPELESPQSSLEWIYLISLWNDLYEKIGGTGHENLRGAADELDLDKKALELLDSNRIDKKISGIITLGHLEDRNRIDRIKELTKSPVTILKMQSIKALTILDPEDALYKIFDHLIENPDQTPNYYLSFCRQIDEAIILNVTLDRLETVGSEVKPRIIPFLELARNQPAREYVRDELIRSEEPEVLSSCLKVLRKIGEPSDQELVEQFLSHEVDFVRIQSARTLGSIGTVEVTDSLIEALADANWWVRYRAAESLVKLPSQGLDDLNSILSELKNSRSKQVLRSAISEVGIA